MQLTNLRRLLVDEIQELFIAETLFEEELKRMQLGADSSELKKVLGDCREQADAQMKRLGEVCSLLAESPRGGRGISVKGLVHETEDRMGEGGAAWVVDASLIAAARRFVLWQVATYGTAKLYAEAIEQGKVGEMLGKTLGEKQAMDERLLRLAGAVRDQTETPAH